MTPKELSDETHRDSEPSIAVNPANPRHIAASAFTVDPQNSSNAPIYVSTDGGQTWALQTILPFAHPETGTGDITLRFGASSNVLYAAALNKAGSPQYGLHIFRTPDFASGAMMQLLQQRGPADQPHVRTTPYPASGPNVDRVYVGYTDNPLTIPGPATIDRSLDGSSGTAAPFAQRKFSDRPNCGRDGPVRPAVHQSGRIYGAFINYKSNCNGTSLRYADVIVVRDDNWGDSPTPFNALMQGTVRGKVVAADVRIPFGQLLGKQRVGMQIAVAVDPSNQDRVYVAWADGPVASYTVRVRRSNDGGNTWSTSDLLTASPATNPSVAINSWGRVAVLYQKLNGGNWETWLERSTDDFATPASRMQLHRAPDNVTGNPPAGPLGDYNDLMAVGRSFYGVFSGNNTPDPANFPQGVRYQRVADFVNRKLLKEDNTTAVDVSIDPFFFAVHEPIFEICRFRPALCQFSPKMERGAIKLHCAAVPCLVIDELPKNCQVKFNCPVCKPGAMCPPYYHLKLDGLDKAWSVSLIDADGNPAQHDVFRSGDGAVISFRPSKERFLDGRIGTYSLAFEMGPDGRAGVEHSVKTELAVAEAPYRPPQPRLPLPTR